MPTVTIDVQNLPPRHTTIIPPREEPKVPVIDPVDVTEVAVPKDVSPWIVSAQIYQGSAWSKSAKAAGWNMPPIDESLPDLMLCQGRMNDEAMYASVRPIDGGRFVVKVSYLMDQNAELRLFINDLTIDLYNRGQSARIADGKEITLSASNDEDDIRPPFTLRVDRNGTTVAITLNGEEFARFGDSGRAYSKIGLKVRKDSVHFSQFSLTGQLIQIEGADPAEAPANERSMFAHNR